MSGHPRLRYPTASKDVDARHKAGHDDNNYQISKHNAST